MRAIPLYLGVGLALLSASPAYAQSTASAKAGSTAPARASATVDPKAVAALEKMGAYLRTLKQFSVHGDSTFDLVMDDGQKLQLLGTVDYKVRAPNAMAIELKTDRKDRQLFYDGKQLTVYGARTGYYATVDAPPTKIPMSTAIPTSTAAPPSTTTSTSMSTTAGTTTGPIIPSPRPRR